MSSKPLGKEGSEGQGSRQQGELVPTRAGQQPHPPRGANILANIEVLSIKGGAAAAVDDYLEYKRIVGDDDGGKVFTPKEYEEYKKRVLPMRLRNRLYVSWRSPTGMDCILVGPETLCFCEHRYKQHRTDFEVLPQERPINLPCKVKRCQCRAYLYVPRNGSSPIRCRCKHFSDEHSEANGHRCKRCATCTGFYSSFTCGCGQPAHAHTTVVETKEERLAQGKPVGQDVPYAAMGGLTGFSSLAEGYMRMDPSGRGAPSTQFLESPVTNMDHPFLRALGGPPGQPQIAAGMSSTSKQISPLTTEQQDMAYFENRYQERLKAEKNSKGAKTKKEGMPSTSKQP